MIDMPALIRVEQQFSRERIDNIRSEVLAQLGQMEDAVRPGDKIAIAVGSRGIANLALIVRTVVDWVKSRQGEPFIVPAMGSHGGGVAKEQEKILERLGITRSRVGAPIKSSMETVTLPQGEGEHPVYMDRNAYEADGTIVINRVKVHGDFFGEIESGLMKMCAIGLGKHKLALQIHGRGINRLEAEFVKAARRMIKTANIRLGIAVLENAYHETMIIKALPPDRFEEEEKKLLRIYKSIMPRLPVDELDILIVDEIGKDVSGAGMEPKIVGRLRSGFKEPEKPKIRYIVTTDLTDASCGNACGVGLADFITRKLLNKIDLDSTNENVITSGCVEQGRIPIIARDDRQAVEFAIRALGDMPAAQMRITRIKNTLCMSELYMSANLAGELAGNPAVTSVGKREATQFVPGGRSLICFDQLGG